MSLQTTIPHVGISSKPEKHMGNHFSGRVRNLSISHSQNVELEAFLASFGQWPFQAHGNIIFFMWEAFAKPSHLKCPCEPYFLLWQQVEGFRLPFKMSLQASFSHVGATWRFQASL